MCGWLNRLLLCLDACSCGLFSTSPPTPKKMPRMLTKIKPTHKNVAPGCQTNIQKTPKCESTISSDSMHSCESFDDLSDVNNTTMSYHEWKFIKCLNETNQSKIDIMKNINTYDKCVRKIYFKMPGKKYHKFGLNEWNVVNRISHPNVIKFDYLHVDDKYIAIMMPYYKRDYFSKLEQEVASSHFNTPSAISERISTLLIIFSTVKCIHNKNIVHRDLKPENFVVNELGEPVLIDFGFAVASANNQIRNDRRGTPLYVAPEVYLEDSIDGKSADIFSLGAMSWAVIFGCQPWNMERTDSFYETFNTPINDTLKQLQELIKEMTRDAPNKRPNIHECVHRLNNINTAYLSCDEVMNEFLLLSN